VTKIIGLIFTICFAVLSSLTFAAADNTDETPAEAEKKSSPPASSRPKTLAPKPADYFFKSDADRQFQADEIKPLLAGDSDFYALFRDDMTGRARGVALLVPDWSQNAASNRGIDSLRTVLPEYGWVTLSMAVPQSRERVFVTQIPKERPLQPANLSAELLRTFDEDYMNAYELQMKLRMEALINEAQNYQGYFIVIAQGSSAAVLASLFAKEELMLPEAFIVLDAFVPDVSLNQAINQNIAMTSVPTLDIYQTSRSRWVEKHIKLRRMLAKKHFKISYRATELYGDISYHNQNRRLLKIIYGWLSRHGL
jgi:hypothetical protein